MNAADHSLPRRPRTAINAANDRAPRDKRSMVQRFADAMGAAMLALMAMAIAGIAVAEAAHATDAAILFCGAAMGAAVTLILISWFEARLHG